MSSSSLATLSPGRCSDCPALDGCRRRFLPPDVPPLCLLEQQRNILSAALGGSATPPPHSHCPREHENR
eukprot:COSAG02_NODE_54_length_43941_cov_54.857990_13_plen_69_part_00